MMVRSRRHDGRFAALNSAHVCLDDHAAWTLAQEICSGGADPALTGGGVDRRPVDHVGAAALRFLHERRAPVTRANEPGVYLDSRPPRLDARTLQHRAPLCLLLLHALLERQLAGHVQHEDRIHDALFADQLRRAVKDARADVRAEHRDERRAVLELGEFRRALMALRAASRAQVEAVALPVEHVHADPERQPRDPGDRDLAVQDRHYHECQPGAREPEQREQRQLAAAHAQRAWAAIRAWTVRLTNAQADHREVRHYEREHRAEGVHIPQEFSLAGNDRHACDRPEQQDADPRRAEAWMQAAETVGHL